MGDHRVQSGPEDGCLDGDVDELRLAGGEAAVVRNERSDGALRRGVVPRLRNGDAHRPPIGFAVQRHHAAHRGERQIAGEVASVGAILTKRRDRDVDEPRVHRAESLEAETARRHLARSGVLEEKIRARHELSEAAASGFGVDVERDASLAAVQRMKAQALEAAGQGGIDRRLMSRCAALRGLELDHVGAEAGQNQRGESGT